VTTPSPVRFRFADYVLSPRQRVLLRDGRPVALIPRYFDLLHLLVVRRREAVSKQTIFAEVWSDVVVSDGALAQAVRTLRRALGDDSRGPRFIRTVSRHGYQFVWPDVAEEADAGEPTVAPRGRPDEPTPEALEPLVDRLLIAAATGPDAEGEARDLAERLHALGTDQAMAALVARPRHAAAVALMRDARWSVPGAGEVPLLSDPEAWLIIRALIALRLADAGRTVARRWAGAALGGAAGGAIAGALGGMALYLSPASSTTLQSVTALIAIGAVAGGLGAAGIGAGLAAAEVVARSHRSLALAVCGAAAGAIAAALAHALVQALLDGLFGMRLSHVPGLWDGLALGGAAGIGYGLAARPPGGGLAAPSGLRRLRVVASVGLATAIAGAALALSGRPLIGGLLHEIARLSRAQLVMTPLGNLIGEPDFGPITRALLSAFEGGAFGSAIAWGLTRRPSRSAPTT
jgi:DNA-binding winged helix-turn-helix (wHTH) protein